MPTKDMVGNPNYSNGGCVYNMDMDFIVKMLGTTENGEKAYVENFYPKGNTPEEKWNAYQADKTANGGKAAGLKIPFRYETFTMYGFCLPSLDTDAVGAFG